MAADADAGARVARRLADAGVRNGDTLIVVHVSAGNPFRRWPEPAFVRLVASLAAQSEDRRLVLSSGPSDRAASAANLSPRRGRSSAPPRPVSWSAVSWTWPSCGRSSSAAGCSLAATRDLFMWPRRPRRPWSGSTVRRWPSDRRPGGIRGLRRLPSTSKDSHAVRAINECAPWRFSMPDDFAAGDRYRSGRAPAGPDRTMIDREDGEPSGLERAAYLLLLGFAGAPLFSIFIAELLLALAAVLWLVIVIRGRERIAVPAMFWPLLALRRRDDRLGHFLGRPPRQLPRFQAARSLRGRPDRLPAAPRSADAESGRRHDHGWGVERGLRNRPVRHLRFRQPGSASIRARSGTT